VAHRDVAVMTIASFLGVLAGLLIRMGLYSGMMGGGRSRGGDRDQGAPAFLVILLVSVVVYAVSFLLIRVLSRYRELSADRAGAVLTGAPSALSSALVKITGEMGSIPTRDLRSAEPLNAFFFTPAISSGFSLSSLFSTHPSLEQRLAQLRDIEADLGRR
jgi:heat shock protein HtpX